MNSTPASAGPQVERVPPLDREEFQAYVDANRPVLITGAMEGQRALREWSLETLRSRCGHREVPVRYFPEGYAGPHSEIPMRLDRYIDLMETNSARRDKVYLGEVSVSRLLPELARDLAVPPLFDPARLANDGMFLGEDPFSPAHYHTHEESLLTEILGSKEVDLYPPEQMDLLYPRPWWEPMSNVSRMDLAAPPDFARFPKFARAQPLRCTVGPGDMLFLPIHWWHFVRGSGLTISVTYFWRADRRFRFRRAALRALPRYGVTLPARRVVSRLRRMAEGRPGGPS